MSISGIVCLIVVVFFFTLMLVPFAGLVLGDIELHADILFSAGYVAPVLFIAALYESTRS